MALHRVLVCLFAGCQGLGSAQCRLPAAKVHRHTASKGLPWNPPPPRVPPPEHRPAVTAIGAKLCATGSLFVGEKTRSGPVIPEWELPSSSAGS